MAVLHITLKHEEMRRIDRNAFVIASPSHFDDDEEEEASG